MSKPKHTQGPWVYQEDSDEYTHIVRPKSNAGQIICHLRQDASGTAEANARLIAAAPEMLAMLKEIESYGEGGHIDEQVYDKIGTLVKKFKGNS